MFEFAVLQLLLGMTRIQVFWTIKNFDFLHDSHWSLPSCFLALGPWCIWTSWYVWILHARKFKFPVRWLLLDCISCEEAPIFIAKWSWLMSCTRFQNLAESFCLLVGENSQHKSHIMLKTYQSRPLACSTEISTARVIFFLKNCLRKTQPAHPWGVQHSVFAIRQQ